MLNLRPDIHFKDLPQPLAADIQTILSKKLQHDMEQEAITNLFGGQDLQTALKNAVCDISRLLKPCGWVSFDEEPAENFDGKKKKSLKETVFVPAQDQIEDWRTTIFDQSTESMLDALAEGTAALGKLLSVSQRRAQQILKEEINRLQNGGGQDLFGGVKL